MSGLLEHLRVSLRLHFRNTMALIYGYLFPLIFLVAFWVLYRHEKIPLVRHMGELLTVTVLGGACFGLPTTLVSERERGVWRRYRLTPAPTWALVTSTVLARFAILLSAGALQLAVAFAFGLPAVAHPAALAVAFAAVSFALIGIGLVIASLADNVPAVQALGQCIFLPMLIIGGVAVPLASLPPWAQHVSAFFPGRYAVEALQSAVNGAGFAGARFPLAALVVIGAAACVAGARLFRWDAHERFAARAGKAWILAALGAWLAIGWLAESRGRVFVPATPAAAPAVSPPAPPPPAVPKKPAPSWTKITPEQVASLDYANLPPDDGIVSPIAPDDEDPWDEIAEQVGTVRNRLPTWQPANEDDDLQCVRALLCVCAVPDAIQMPPERYLPRVVMERLIDTYPKDKLVKMLTWIALHPEQGIVIDTIEDLGVPGEAGDPELVRERVALYAIKFVARLTDRKYGP